jgi:hypothetical protein
VLPNLDGLDDHHRQVESPEPAADDQNSGGWSRPQPLTERERVARQVLPALTAATAPVCIANAATIASRPSRSPAAILDLGEATLE